MATVGTATFSARTAYLVLLLPGSHSQFLVAFLQRNGYSVAVANSPDELIALCQSNSTHAVLIDVCRLAEIEGWTVAQCVKQVRPFVSVMLVCHGVMPKTVEPPVGVDALVSDAELPELLAVLDEQTISRPAAQRQVTSWEP